MLIKKYLLFLFQSHRFIISLAALFPQSYSLHVRAVCAGSSLRGPVPRFFRPSLPPQNNALTWPQHDTDCLKESFTGVHQFRSMSLYKLIQKGIKEYKALGWTYGGCLNRPLWVQNGAGLVGRGAHSPYEDRTGQLMLYEGFIWLRLSSSFIPVKIFS